MDQIRIYDLEVYAHHGVFPEENKMGQPFLVSAVLETDIRAAGLTDDLQKSIDYGSVCHFITEYMQKHTYKLLETVLEHLAEELLMQLSGLRRVELEIKKPQAPIGLPFGNVSVRICRQWHRVYLSIGSNMGDRLAFLKFGLDRLEQDPRICGMRVSNILETEPYGYTEQPPFANGAVELETLYTPYELLDVLHRIEQEAGRERKIHWGPRTLDMDILFYDSEILERPDLIVPHADMANRAFVLEPLAELCPGKVHPVLGKTILSLRNELRKKENRG